MQVMRVVQLTLLAIALAAGSAGCSSDHSAAEAGKKIDAAADTAKNAAADAASANQAMKDAAKDAAALS
jgi:hypothetical protein